MTPADTQAALDAATATLASGQCDEYSARHASDVLALVACVSALRDVLSQTERERDEARARIARYVAARDALNAVREGGLPTTHDEWAADDRRCHAVYEAHDTALAALRGEEGPTPADEGDGR